MMRARYLLILAGAMLAAPAHAADWGPVERDPSVSEVPFDPELFKKDPEYDITYDPEAEIEIYGGKTPVPNPKPPIELGRGLYDPGEIGDGIKFFGDKNRLFPALSVFGDLRTAVAFNDNGGKEVAQIAARANLNFNLELTGTERIHMFWRPLQDGGQFTRYEFAGNDESDGSFEGGEPEDEPAALFFEGDLGAIYTGLSDEYTSWDMPFAVGLVPFLYQNGVWMDDAILGGAVTIPAQNSAALDITNYDLTFFFGLDRVSSDAFTNDAGARADHEANLYGLAGFFDVAEGYLELGYAYLDDQDHSNGGDQSYHNITAAFSKRYFGKIANAVRIIGNFGQDEPGGAATKTASGFVVLVENVFITHSITLVPYANAFIGKDTPQSAARAGGAGGVLRNVGLSFETDGLTGFPKLDDTAHDTMGGAIGIEYLFGFDQQIVGEIAGQLPWDDEEGISDGEMAFGMRYQKPLTNRLIFRADAMYGILFGGRSDITGVRAELRLKL